MQKMKRILTACMAMAMAFTVCQTTVRAADDFALDGGGGESTFVKTIQGDGNNYTYNGFVTTDGAPTDLKYMQFTYTGDITYLRLEFENKDGAKAGPYWFTADQATHFVSADGTEIPTVASSPTTVTIDLAASGVDLATVGNKGFHLHYGDAKLTNGTATITDAKLTNNGPAATTPTDTTAPADTKAATDTKATDNSAAKTGSSVVPTAVAGAVILCAGTVLAYSKKKRA